MVSRQHTEVFERDGKLFVRDLGSLNGTFVNNLKIDDETLLGPNQLLTLGNVTFRAVYEVATDTLESSGDSETISFDEVKTREVGPKVEPKKKANPKAGSGEIDTTETVPVDELGLAARAKQSAPPAKPGPAGNSKATAEKDAAEVELDDSKKAPTGSDTDKSFKTIDNPAEESISSIFSFEEESGAGQSVAISALGDLPSAVQSAVSFVGNVDLGEDAKPAASQIDSVEIDLGIEKKPTHEDDDSGLGSFLNKLPR